MKDTRAKGYRDPLGPLSSIVTFFTGLVMMAMVVVPLTVLTTGGEYGFGAWGLEEPCVDLPQQGLWIGGSDAAFVAHLRPGVRESAPSIVRLCQAHMDAATRTLFTVPAALELLWFLGFLLITRLLIHTARRQGLFTAAVARGVTRLGWYLLAGHLVVEAISGVATAFGTDRLVTGFHPWVGAVNAVEPSWPTIIAACGVLTVGRIMARSVQMSEDLEGTV